MDKKITVRAVNAGRLDKYLLSLFPRYSRAYLKEQIRLGNFLVNNKKVKSFYALRQGDQVALAPGFVLPEAAPISPNKNIKLDIVYEDNNVIVINKPAGLSVHPRQDKNGLPLASELDNTLVSGLLARYPTIITTGDSPALRPGIVHRLDKDTSGVMIIAKNQKSFEWLKKQFKERKVNKKYLALVHGLLKNKEGEIKTLLARSRSDPTKQKVAKTGKEAVTRYKVIKEFKNYTLLEACPQTGRLHQIRVQLAWFGHPVVGDKKYGPRLRQGSGGQTKKSLAPVGLKRQFLHAQELTITLPDNGKKTFNVPLPADLNEALKTLEKKQ